MATRARRPGRSPGPGGTDAAREQKLAALQDRLAEQVAALSSGQDWQRWLTLAARLHGYSFQNTLLILSARPDASLVAGYEAWKALGRQVAKGEKGIAILAPILRRRDPASPEDPAGGRWASAPPNRSAEENQTATGTFLAGFRVTYVWDIAQTTGPPLPEPPRPQLLAGAAPPGLWEALTGAVAASGFSLDRGSCGGANGVTDFGDRVVRVRDDCDDAQAVKTLAHELAHVRLHHPRDLPLAEGQVACRGIIEVEAESVAYLVSAVHGLDTGTYSFPYLAGWAESVPGTAPADVVRATGERVLTAARWVLHRTEHLTWADTDTRTDTRTETRADASAEVSAEARARTGAVRAGELRASADRDRLLAVHAHATRFFRQQLPGSWVPSYLEQRALVVAADDPWQAGYAPRRWTALTDHLRAAGVDDSTLLACGLVTRARSGNLIDRFRDRLMLPLRDLDGNVIAFVGRAHVDADPRAPKYLNSPTTALYNKRSHLFGLAEGSPELRGGALPVLVEGPLDAIAVTTGTQGRCVGISPCGTALTTDQLDRLGARIDLGQRGIVVATDHDQAGQDAAGRALTLLAVSGVDPRSADLPPGQDPAALLATAGPAALTAALLERSTWLADRVIDERLDQWRDRLGWAEGRIGALRDTTPLLAALPGEPARRNVARVAARLDLPPELVAQETRQAAARSRSAPVRPRTPPPTSTTPYRRSASGR